MPVTAFSTGCTAFQKPRKFLCKHTLDFAGVATAIEFTQSRVLPLQSAVDFVEGGHQGAHQLEPALPAQFITHHFECKLSNTQQIVGTQQIFQLCCLFGDEITGRLLSTLVGYDICLTGCFCLCGLQVDLLLMYACTVKSQLTGKGLSKQVKNRAGLLLAFSAELSLVVSYQGTDSRLQTHNIISLLTYFFVKNGIQHHPKHSFCCPSQCMHIFRCFR